MKKDIRIGDCKSVKIPHSYKTIVIMKLEMRISQVKMSLTRLKTLAGLTSNSYLIPLSHRKPHQLSVLALRSLETRNHSNLIAPHFD